MRRRNDESLTLRRFIMDGRVKPGHDERWIGASGEIASLRSQ
jgi:hypothetical protein